MTECDPAWLSDMRNILVTGMLLTTALYAILNWPERKPAGPSKGSPAFCKLHSRTEDLCRDMHDPQE